MLRGRSDQHADVRAFNIPYPDFDSAGQLVLAFGNLVPLSAVPGALLATTPHPSPKRRNATSAAALPGELVVVTSHGQLTVIGHVQVPRADVVAPGITGGQFG